MGRKKRVKPSSSCSAPAAAYPAAVGVKAAFPSASSLSHGSPNKEAKKAADMEAIKLDCDRAFDAFRRGNHHKALKLMKKFCSSYPNSGFVHTLQGTMYYQLALTIADSSTKLQYLKTAADSASRATLLLPEKMDSAHFFAHLLYLTSEKNDGYQEVVRECERALSIPLEKASLLVGRNQLEGSILMAQISELQEGLRSLIGMSNETMNNGVHLDLEAKFMLVPFSDLLKESKLLSLKYSEDGMELKDLEEREKEIEAKIQKTKLLENLRVLPEWQTEEASLQNYLKDGVPESSSRSSHKQERQKRVSNLKKMKESARMMPYVVMYWDSISFDQKRRLLNVRIGDLIEYFGSNEYVEEALIFCEAMSFAKDNKSWKFLGCCFCSQRFKELTPYLKHLEVQHLRNVKVLAPEMMSMLPLELNSYWVDMLLKDRWKPVDTSAALKMIESGPKGELSCTVGGDRESHGGEVGGDENIKEVDGEKGLPDAFPFDHNWPLSYDSERAGILSKIHIMFKLFFRHNYLSERLLKVLIKYSLEKLQTLVPELEPLIQGLDQTPLCLCFLQVPQLKYVYHYLEDLVRLCRLDFRSEKDGSVAETPRGGFDIKHRIGLSSESVSLLLDEHSNRGAVDFFTYHDNISDDASSVAFTVDNLEDDALPGSDSLAAWIFEGPSNEQQLTSWARALQEKKHQAIDILSILEKEFPEYKSLCDSKCIHLRQEEAFQAVENILAEEFTKRRENLEFVPQGYEVLLKKRQEELARTSNDVFGNDAAEFTFISKVLKEVEALNLRVAGGTSHLSDQESDQEDESKTFEDLLEQDSLLEMAVQDQKEEVSLKLCEIDTSLMRCVGVMRNLESKLGKISVIDYRSILWDHLEDLARKYATEKSDAVGRALLLEAALDTQKNINTADDNTKKTQKKSKKKKKNKSSRDAKDSKATGGIEQLLISDSPKSETAAALKQQEEESRPHELELQAQETWLEEQYHGTDLDEQVSPHSVNQNVELKQLGEESRHHELELQAQETQLEEQYQGAELDEQVSLHSDNQNEELKEQEEESRRNELELQAQERKLGEQNGGVELDEQVSPHSVNQNVELKQLGGESRHRELELQAQETQLKEQYRGAELDEQVSLHSDNQNEELKEQEEESRQNELELQAQERKLGEQNGGVELDEQVSPHSDSQNVELKQQKEESRRLVLELRANVRKLLEILEDQRQIESGGRQKQLTGQSRNAELDEQVSPFSDYQNLELKQLKEESRRLELELRAQERKLEEQNRGVELDEQVSPQPDNQNEELKQQEEELELQAQERELQEQIGGSELDEQVSPHSDNENVELKQQKEESRRLELRLLELELREQERELLEILEYQRQIDSGGRQKQLTGQSRSAELDEQVSPLSDNQIEELKSHLELELQAQERELLEILEDQRQIERGGRQKQLIRQSGSAELDEQVHPRKFTGRTDTLPDSNSSISSSNKEKPHPDLSVGEYKEPKVLAGLPGGRTSEDSVLSPDQRGSQCTFDDMNASDVHGTSLKKSLAQYDCFLDVIITSLWHLRWFRFELQRRTKIPHAHAGNPCVFCSLCNTFTVLSLSPVCWKKDVVAPCLAKMALSDLYPDNIFFQEAQTNDVISILVGIFDCLHQSFSAPGEKYSGENWDCTSDECLAHTIIGMNLLERISCCYCGLESGNEQFTSFLRMVDESKLRRMKDMYMDSSFDKLLKLVNASSLFPCDREAGGCGKLNPTQHFLSSPPHVFITVIDRKNGHERMADISTTLAALSTKIDLGILYEGLDEGNAHYLISLKKNIELEKNQSFTGGSDEYIQVCFTGKNYRCFAYRHEVEKWIMLDDEECKVIGCWDDVITVCRTRNLQPLILFFEDEMQIF